MAIKENKWHEKDLSVKSKKKSSANSFRPEPVSDVLSAKRPKNRSSSALKVNLVRTLRGVRR